MRSSSHTFKGSASNSQHPVGYFVTLGNSECIEFKFNIPPPSTANVFVSKNSLSPSTILVSHLDGLTALSFT